MVNMIGFHHKEPEHNTAIPGEPGYYVTLKPIPSKNLPFKAKVSTPCGTGVFFGKEDAELFLEAPHREMALHYLEWLSEVMEELEDHFMEEL